MSVVEETSFEMARFFISYEIFFFLLVTQKTLGQVPRYQCMGGKQNNTWCILPKVNHTASNKNFKVIPHRDPSEVDGATFIKSKIEILTDDVCNALPYLKTFNDGLLGLVYVDENAFRKCTKLLFVMLQGNLLTNLSLVLFETNVNLFS